MWKRDKLLFTFLILFAVIFSTGVIYAEEIDISTIDENAVLEETEGITPDSIFYPIDKFFDNFADDVKVRQEAVAEIRAMIEEEKYDDALEALEKYRKHAEELEREVSPEQRDEARRSAAAIYNVLKSLESQIPDEYKGDFFDDIIEREERIITAVEIAGKIKELCEELSELDPLQYSRVCKTDDDAPRWHRDLDDRLTDEQRQEAEEFFDIMLQCFETSGGECRCEDISIVPFANKCSQIAPLAYACDVEGDEAACDQMNEIEDEEPIEHLLPDYLQDVLRAIEERFSDAQFDNHAPRECREAGATTREECMNIMFRLNAPQECVDAFEGGEISLDNEREAREACEEIMFDLHAPEECIERGIRNPRECGILMFQLNAPEQCIKEGLTGENRGDERKCMEIMESRGIGTEGFRSPAFGARCREIQNPEERLRCYDAAVSGAEFEHFESAGLEGVYPEQCQEANALTRESCEKVMREFFESQQQEFEEFHEEEFTEPEKVCTTIFEPVCGVDGLTYSNSCFAGLENVEIACIGECPCEVKTIEPCPALPTVDSCLEGQEKVVVFSSPECGTYYGCEEITTETQPITTEPTPEDSFLTGAFLRYIYG